MTKSSPHKLVIGVGNDYRGDDGVGLAAARLIRRLAPMTVTVQEGVSDGYSLVDSFNGFEEVFVIDCTVSNAEPGTICSYDATNGSIPSELFRSYSTHSIGIEKAVELAKKLGHLPKHLTVYGIEGYNFEAGVGLSPRVEAAVEKLAAMVLEKLS
jgi:hydrogenase maturation protease